MKAGIYSGKESVDVRELPFPEFGDDDVLIENIYSSISESDIAFYRDGPGTGYKALMTGEFGHETISRVMDFGANAADFNLGERVYPYPQEIKREPGRAGAIGAFSEYIVAEDAVRNQSLYPIPDEISDRLACLIEPFTVGCRAARRGMAPRNPGDIVACMRDDRPIEGDVRYAQGQHAVVFGCNTIGIAAACAFAWFGMEKIMICDSSEFRLGIAGSLGFAVCNTLSENFPEKACSYFGTVPALNSPAADIDCWLDASGVPSILEDFMKSGKMESRFISAAANKMPRNLDLLHLLDFRKSIIGSAGYKPEDVYDVIDIMRSGVWDLEKIITHEFPLDRLDEAIRTAADPEQALNVIIRF